VVGTGIVEGLGTAMFTSGWDMSERIFGSIDPSNPGSFFCHAAFDADGKIARFGQDHDEIERYAQEHGLTNLSAAPITYSPEILCSGNWRRHRLGHR
jgi:hypothetical protein